MLGLSSLSVALHRRCNARKRGREDEKVVALPDVGAQEILHGRELTFDLRGRKRGRGLRVALPAGPAVKRSIVAQHGSPRPPRTCSNSQAHFSISSFSDHTRQRGPRSLQVRPTRRNGERVMRVILGRRGAKGFSARAGLAYTPAHRLSSLPTTSARRYVGMGTSWWNENVDLPSAVVQPSDSALISAVKGTHGRASVQGRPAAQYSCCPPPCRAQTCELSRHRHRGGVCALVRWRVLARHDAPRVDGLALRKEKRVRFAGGLLRQQPLHARGLGRRGVAQRNSQGHASERGARAGFWGDFGPRQPVGAEGRVFARGSL